VQSPSLLDFQASINIPETNSANIRSGILPALNFWSQFEILRKPVSVTVFSEKDYEWYMARWVALGRDNTGQGQWDRTLGSGGGAVGWNSEGQRNIWFKIPPNSPAEQSLLGIDRPLDYYFHEITHYYQASIIGVKFGEAPCWFPEGAAMLIGFANSFENTDSNTKYVREARVLKLRELVKFLSDKQLSEPEILKLLNNYPATNPMCQHIFPQLGYGLGWFVNEKLVSDFGWDNYLKFWREMGKSDWESAFKESYAISFSAWASESFAPYMLTLLKESS